MFSNVRKTQEYNGKYLGRKNTSSKEQVNIHSKS